jgi:hypothetical protein
MSDEWYSPCAWCGGETPDEELVNGKCVSCIVNDCSHTTFEEIDQERGYKSPWIRLHYVCMDCEVNWSVLFKLDNGVVSKYKHEDCNAGEINEL